MAWTFRRRVKVIPGVYINLGKNGISTSIGVRDAHLNFSNRGHSFKQEFGEQGFPIGNSYRLIIMRLSVGAVTKFKQ